MTLSEPSDSKRTREFRLADFSPIADGVSDDTDAFQRCFAAASSVDGACIRIEPGDYLLSGREPITLASHQQITAHGARIHMPRVLGDQARLVLFAGCDLVDVCWRGGCFIGHCFDHRQPSNTWEPNVNTRIFLITTSEAGTTARIVFDGIQARRVAGAVISVYGASPTPADPGSRTYATDITVRHCQFDECGKFMWDYGLLWQIVIWPEDYDAEVLAMAQRYSFDGLVQGPVTMRHGDDRVLLDNAAAGIAASASAGNDESLCFFGDTLPDNIRRGRQYYVLEATAQYIRIAESYGGPAIRFVGDSGPRAVCMTTLHRAYYHLFAPIGAGPGKGAVDLTLCKHVMVTGNRLSALGDTMHIQCADSVIFSGNQITGSRMGAFFIAEYCSTITVTGNTVDGSNGSRVMSVEKNCTDITIVGNTFRGGGRGSWINQPQGIVLANNVFVDNTTKGTADPWSGRKTFLTGDYERYPELYFTTFEENGTYGPVIVENNLFKTGTTCKSAIQFEAGGHDIIVRHNVIQGDERRIEIDPSCRDVIIDGNPGAVVPSERTP